MLSSGLIELFHGGQNRAHEHQLFVGLAEIFIIPCKSINITICFFSSATNSLIHSFAKRSPAGYSCASLATPSFARESRFLHSPSSCVLMLGRREGFVCRSFGKLGCPRRALDAAVPGAPRAFLRGSSQLPIPVSPSKEKSLVAALFSLSGAGATFARK